MHSACERIEAEFGRGGIKSIFNVSGIVPSPPKTLTQLFPEKTVTKVSYADALETFKVNTLGPLLMMKHFLPLLPRKATQPTKLFPYDFGVVASLSARVGSIADNKTGGWYSYRASKAAQNQITKTLSMELGFGGYKAVTIGYHPGTVETALSGSMGRKRREAGGKGVFTVPEAVEHMVRIISGLSPADSGKVLDWEGKQIPS
jgi:NAD(P)-dependent dehydrogenase (short-subunit alcohol dehydrogenase family)